MGLTGESKALFRRYTTELKKQFQRVDYAWVGPEAFRALQAGWNLTQDVRRTRDYSLKLAEEVKK